MTSEIPLEEAPPPARKRWWWVRPTLTVVFYVLLVAGLAYYLSKVDWASLRDLSLNPGWLVCALVLAIGFRYWQTFIWITVLRNLGARDVRMSPELIEVYSKSWLGRYVPGTAPWILGKIFFASKHGVSRAKLAIGSLVEAGVQIVVLLATSSLFLLLDPQLDVVPVWIKLAMVGVIVVGVIVLLPGVFNRIIAGGLRLLRRPPLDVADRATGRTILVASLQYLLGALLSGSSLFFVAKSVYPALGFDNFFFVVAASNLAGAISMLAVFAPGGLGVREGTQLALFQTIMPGAIAAVIVVFTRLWGITMDVLFFLAGKAILAIANRRRR